MHPTLELLFGHLQGGLLWLAADGRLKYANAHARSLGRFEVGQPLADDTLRKAAAVIASGRHDRPIQTNCLPPGGQGRLLQATVAPGLTRGEVFVLVSEAEPHGERLSLDNLMTVIRSDLTPPLEHLTQSLQLLIDGRSNAVATEEALQHGSAIVDTLRRLVDLSSLWSSDSLLANDRLEVWALLQQAWEKTRAFAQTRRVSVRLINQIAPEAMPVTYGSAFWIQRVVLESLQAALRAASPGATLDIELRQMGPRVLIVFRNSGMWPAAAREAVVLNDAQARRTDAPRRVAMPIEAKDLIGLHLCERIIRLHGGLLREEADELGLRNFLIDLPTGAPGREGDGHALDAAQAQRYAADLSALMARRRKAAGPPQPTQPAPL